MSKMITSVSASFNIVHYSAEKDDRSHSFCTNREMILLPELINRNFLALPEIAFYRADNSQLIFQYSSQTNAGT